MSRFVYSRERLREVRFPMGGIGAGAVSIDGGGRLVDWEIYNRPNKESYNGFSHLAVKAEKDGKLLDARVMNGPYRQGRMGRGLHGFGGYTYGPDRHTMVGVPHFEDLTMEARFPIADYRFEGPFPGRVSLRAWSPFEPMNDFDSSLPLALFEATVENTTGEALDYYLAFTLCNPVRDFPVNRVEMLDGHHALCCDSALADKRDGRWGQACVVTDAADTSAQQNWYRGSWFDNLNVFWQDFCAPGHLRPRALDGEERPGNVAFDIEAHGTLCAHVRAEPGQTVRVRFALGWYFPNYVKYWGLEAGNEVPTVMRNWYASRFADAKAVAGYGMAQWDRMLGAASAFADTLYGGTLPEAVLDAAGSTLAVLKSPTCVRLSDGSFYGWEGSHARDGSCEGSCQHVWNYQYALPMLFPALERSMRELDYKYNTRSDGSMGFRLQLPVGAPPSAFRACADGQLGGVIKSYREWKVSGDTDWLGGLWPWIRRTVEFVWSKDNPDRWDPEMSGVLTGRQHHTLDMELFGPNSWLTGMYLTALEAAARMADTLGEEDFAVKCRTIRQKGIAAVDTTLYNGEYFYQQIDLNDKAILDGFYTGEGDELYDAYWNAEAGEIKYQIGEGCSVDQLYGQWHADLLGLGDAFDPAKTQTALAAIHRHNFVPDMRDFFNPCRIYCMENEGGTLICAYPEGRRRPVISVPYAEETMHGFEYTAACHMILRGMEAEGLACVTAVRDRYDGQYRNPWNEIECGGNYARSMAAWSLVMAYQGLRFDMTEKRIGFAPMHAENHESLWALSTAWGRVRFAPGQVALDALGGSIVLGCLELPDLPSPKAVRAGDQEIPFVWADGAIRFDREVELAAGERLTVTFATEA